jgi:hypothetical protein
VIEELLVAVLIGDSRVTDLIGTGDDARITPDVLEQDGALPALVYQDNSEVTGYTHDGPGLVRVRFQIDVYASTRVGARRLARAVRSVLHDYPGEEDGIQDFEAAPGGGASFEAETKRYRHRSDWFATARDQAV